MNRMTNTYHLNGISFGENIAELTRFMNNIDASHFIKGVCKVLGKELDRISPRQEYQPRPDFQPSYNRKETIRDNSQPLRSTNLTLRNRSISTPNQAPGNTREDRPFGR